MSYISVKHVSKIFGSQAKHLLEKVHQGMSKEMLMNEHKHVLGLYDINLAIEAGEIFVIMGLSGSGKSTLIRHFNRLIEPTEGEIIINGENVTQLSAKKLRDFRRDNLSMVFQHFGLLPHRKVIDNVAYGLSIQPRSDDDIHQQALKWLDIVGLAGYQDAYPSALSGGEQQRVGLARALATGTDILLMDEAFSALDPLIRSQMQQQLLHLQSELNKTIIFITHDLAEALLLGTRIAILNEGKIAQIGTPEEILLHPADDYVRSFIQDVNRAKVLTVKNIMRKPKLILTHNSTQQALAELQHQALDYAWVMTEKGVSLVTEESLSLHPANTTLQDIAVPQPSLTPQETLETLLPLAVGNPHPIPVLDSHNQFVGVVDATQVRSLL